MDSNLSRAWKDAAAPFDGVTVFDDSEEDAGLPVLRQAVIAVIHILQESFLDPELLALDDWHQHDGFGTSGRRTRWSKILEHCQTDQAFLYFKTDDFMVFRGIYPKTMQFYLRVYVDEDSTAAEGMGKLDVTVPAGLGAAISEAMRTAGMHPSIEKAKPFFDQRAS
ncbi:MAG TPA: hypothetical protein VK843_19645 [Planctomycetota bacterium]|nr:hypothetical protein [Planctomycetota bacterium]